METTSKHSGRNENAAESLFYYDILESPGGKIMLQHQDMVTSRLHTCPRTLVQLRHRSL